MDILILLLSSLNAKYVDKSIKGIPTKYEDGGVNILVIIKLIIASAN